ncbi:MAG: HAD family hydrolase, partial [Oscillospiraceae bacterium]|nr:HAD family hydrolase [Oscillospiraceae bacterium]
MNKPEMIIFDFGHTLLCQPDWDSERGNRELFRYITKNPDGVTVQDYQKEINEVFGQVEEVRASNNCDFSARVVHRV